ncbi:MAG TPA: MFS transporter [Flexivirga sp.]|uniref:MFS transporter n=1 Tax=Flexivirga sp. TaxID=1962927 RepID=UPI002B9C9519|nr:MFS transporter [Flexivirga sp.]HWC24587.1 MFS transporter [Flexivirga sp.]
MTVFSQRSRPRSATALRTTMTGGRTSHRAWFVVGMLVVFQIINFADKAVIGMVAGPAMQELHLSASQFGFIGSSFFFLFSVSSIVIGFVAGRVSTQRILLTLAVIWGVVMFPILLGAGAATLLASRIMLGAAEGPATPISLQHAHGWFAPRERGLPSNLVAIGSTLGPVVAAPVLAWVIAEPALGWRWAFGLLGIVALLWGVAWRFIGKDGPFGHAQDNGDRASEAASAEVGRTEPPATSGSASVRSAGSSVAGRSDQLAKVSIGRLFCSPMFVVAVLTGAGCFWAMAFLTTWAPKYLQTVVHTSPEMVGVIFTLPWIVGALTLLGLGYVSRRLMRSGVTVRWAIGATYSTALLCSGICFLVLPHVSGYTVVAVLAFGNGLAMIFPMAPSAVAYAANHRQRGALMAAVTGLASIGAVVAPYMVGRLMQNSGYRPGAPVAGMAAHISHGMNSAFWMIGIYLVVTGLAGVLLLDPDRTAARLHGALQAAPEPESAVVAPEPEV